MAAAIVMLILDIRHIVLAGCLAFLGVVIAIVLGMSAPPDTGALPEWSMRLAFSMSAATSALMAFASVAFAARAVMRAEAAMEREYDRSEQLLANMLPADIAGRLKEPDHEAIADTYDDASILFADIAGFTERAGETDTGDLFSFLDRLFRARRARGASRPGEDQDLR